MLKKIKQHSLRKSTERNLQNRDVSQRNSPLTYLGFLVDETVLDDVEKIYGLAKEIGLLPKNIKVFTFLETKHRIPSLIQNQINNSEFSWKGEITNQNAREFLDFPFDVLVGFYNKNNPFLNRMISASNAKFTVGFKGVDERLFDLILNVPPQDFPAFQKELTKYLNVLKKI